MLTKKQMTAKRFDFDGFPIDAQEDVCRQYNGGAAARNEKIFNEADDGAMGGALADALGLPAVPKNTAKTYRTVMGGDYREAGENYKEANRRAKELKNRKNASTRTITTAAKDEVKSKTVEVKSGKPSKKSKTSKKNITPAKKSGGKGKGKKVEYAPSAAYRVNRPRSERPRTAKLFGQDSDAWDSASPELRATVRRVNKLAKKIDRSSPKNKDREKKMMEKMNAADRAMQKVASTQGKKISEGWSGPGKKILGSKRKESLRRKAIREHAHELFGFEK